MDAHARDDLEDALERLIDAGVREALSVDAARVCVALGGGSGGVASTSAAPSDDVRKLRDAVVRAMRTRGHARDAVDACERALMMDAARDGDGDGGGVALAFVDALRRSATALQLDALERVATASTAPAMASADASADAMDVDETSERATRALERLVVDDAGARTPAEVLEAAAARAEKTLASLPKNHTEKLLDASSWTSEQRALIERVERALHDEYKARREMVAKRAQVTTTSFCYSSRLNALKAVREEFARRAVSDLHIMPQVTMDDVCDARHADLAMAGIKVTAGRGALNSAVKKIMIGAVPDRGGRTDTNDRAAMPAFQVRVDAPAADAHGSHKKQSAKEKKKGCKRW